MSGKVLGLVRLIVLHARAARADAQVTAAGGRSCRTRSRKDGDRTSEQFVGTMPVQERHRFDVAALEAWLVQHMPGFAGPLQVEQIKGGQSNPTYLLKTPAASHVLRRKPSGKLLPSAHAIEREYRVMNALRGSGVPVPKMQQCVLRDGTRAGPHSLGPVAARLHEGRAHGTL